MKRSIDWDTPTGSEIGISLSKSSFCEPQFKNRVTEKDFTKNGSSRKAQQVRKEIEQKTISKLFGAQKTKIGELFILKFIYWVMTIVENQSLKFDTNERSFKF